VPNHSEFLNLQLGANIKKRWSSNSSVIRYVDYAIKEIRFYPVPVVNNFRITVTNVRILKALQKGTRPLVAEVIMIY
jgi:hypothetical protein